MVTGIVRRVDELGRVVIPKELRRTLGIREGEEIEVTPTEGRGLLLKKFSAIDELNGIKQELLDAVYSATGMAAALTDAEKVVSAAGKGAPKIGTKLSDSGIAALEGRKPSDIPDDAFDNFVFAARGTLCPIFDFAVSGGVFVFGENAKVAAKIVAEFIKNRI